MDIEDYNNQEGIGNDEDRQFDERLVLVFQEIRLVTKTEPDWDSFDKRLLNLLDSDAAPARSEVRASSPEAGKSSRFWGAGLRYAFAAGLAMGFLAVPLFWYMGDLSLQETEEIQSASDEALPLSSGIPLARSEELESEAEHEGDDMTAELIGTSADAFLYGEKKTDSKSKSARKSKEAWTSKLPADLPAVPDQPPELPADPEAPPPIETAP